MAVESVVSMELILLFFFALLTIIGLGLIVGAAVSYYSRAKKYKKVSGAIVGVLIIGGILLAWFLGLAVAYIIGSISIWL